MATRPNTQLATIVGRNIAEAREAAGLTQHQLATKLETSISRVSGWETGQHLPQLRKQHQLAELLFGDDITAMFREKKIAA
jgi:transcriptional regulator with XRE-family HTH domain